MYVRIVNKKDIVCWCKTWFRCKKSTFGLTEKKVRVWTCFPVLCNHIHVDIPQIFNRPKHVEHERYWL